MLDTEFGILDNDIPTSEKAISGKNFQLLKNPFTS
jgi:hypothetical protein